MNGQKNLNPAVNIDLENNYNLKICSEKIRDSGVKISTALTRLAEEVLMSVFIKFIL